MNKNFLNNQNYILGRSEKKKLLSKFYSELFFIKINNFVWLIPKKINYNIFYLVFCIMTFFIIFLFKYLFEVTVIDDIDWLLLTLKIFFSIFIPSLIVTLILSIFLNKNKKDVISIKNLKDKKLYFTKWWDFFSILFFLFLSLLIVMYLIIFWFWYINIIIILLLLISYKKVYKFILNACNLKLLQILFLPFMFSGIYIYSLFIYIFNFFRKDYKKFSIINKKNKVNYLLKFNSITEIKAENKYYIIKIKKW